MPLEAFAGIWLGASHESGLAGTLRLNSPISLKPPAEHLIIAPITM
jgi:hypothetical protein